MTNARPKVRTHSRLAAGVLVIGFVLAACSGSTEGPAPATRPDGATPPATTPDGAPAPATRPDGATTTQPTTTEADATSPEPTASDGAPPPLLSSSAQLVLLEEVGRKFQASNREPVEFAGPSDEGGELTLFLLMRESYQATDLAGWCSAVAITIDRLGLSQEIPVRAVSETETVNCLEPGEVAADVVVPSDVDLAVGVATAAQIIAQRNSGIDVEIFTVNREASVLAAANVAPSVPDEARLPLCLDMRAIADATDLGPLIETIVRDPDRVTEC